MFFSDVEPSKEGKVDLEDAFVVLKDCLEGKTQVLTDHSGRCFFLLLMHIITDHTLYYHISIKSHIHRS